MVTFACLVAAPYVVLASLPSLHTSRLPVDLQCMGLGGASGSDSEETPNWGLSESLTPEVALHRRGTSQLEMFDLYGKPALDQALAGYNVTLMVYGQVGCGGVWPPTLCFHPSGSG